MEIKFTENPNPQEKPADESKLGFGKIFTDYMFLMDYDAGRGWHDARIVPYGPLSLSPASTTLHYGAEVFEGLKAYKAVNGDIQLFRPIENVRRLNNSADRLCLPTIPEEDSMEILTTYINAVKDWVPSEEGTSLYIRPFIFGDDPSLGVHTVSHAVYCIISSPSGAYYPEGIDPVKILIEDEDVRAVRGGTGYTKCGGNYAASARAAERAAQKGYTQVLWLDGVERKYIEEVGAMNVMFKIAGEVITPDLDAGSILPGVTRKSCVELLRSEGYNVSERKLSLDELEAAMENGTLEEAWGTGTAAVVSPIGELRYKDKTYTVNDFKIGPVTQHLYDALTAIQWGKAEDKFGWIYKIN